jgi:hypothetical protein
VDESIPWVENPVAEESLQLQSTAAYKFRMGVPGRQKVEGRRNHFSFSEVSRPEKQSFSWVINYKRTFKTTSETVVAADKLLDPMEVAFIQSLNKTMCGLIAQLRRRVPPAPSINRKGPERGITKQWSAAAKPLKNYIS